ncbi:hypothetical protein Micbo1qcDRAFT_4947 [Microdochium bolleyi]|uniref:Uncharacterized protein n=1 Tax=Microdochium bolleyi TaxID=196109 RepID=A0A136JIT6_9PEZI|nr:hypothetical protein Micbo1qcDRAFT_4947 [Microdochium bolleyi]
MVRSFRSCCHRSDMQPRDDRAFPSRQGRCLCRILQATSRGELRELMVLLHAESHPVSKMQMCRRMSGLETRGRIRCSVVVLPMNGLTNPEVTDGAPEMDGLHTPRCLCRRRYPYPVSSIVIVPALGNMLGVGCTPQVVLPSGRPSASWPPMSDHGMSAVGSLHRAKLLSTSNCPMKQERSVACDQ